MLAKLYMLSGPNVKSFLTKRSVIAVCSFVTLLVLRVPGAAYGQQVVGYVLDSTGTWTLHGNSTPLSPGSPVPARGLLRNQHPVDNDQIVIADLNGRVIK